MPGCQSVWVRELLACVIVEKQHHKPAKKNETFLKSTLFELTYQRYGYDLLA